MTPHDYDPLAQARPTCEPAGMNILPCPRTWGIESLLVAIFLCLPLGIAAMIYSSKVERRYALGQYDRAAEASARARSLTLWGARIGAVVWIIVGWMCLTGTLRSHLFTLAI